MSDTHKDNRRAFDRYAIDHDVEVDGIDQTGEPFHDKARLDNLSGDGAGLLTLCPSHYWQSQTLSLKIKLPDTDRMKAFMLCEATVQWVRPAEAPNRQHELVLVGLSLSGQRMVADPRNDPSAAEPMPDHP